MRCGREPPDLVADREAASEKAREAATAFERVYGADFKRVKAARNPKDAVELAARLLGAAKEAGRQPDFLALLCDKAAELACDHPDGYETALDALDLLSSEVPARADGCSTRMMDIRQKQYARAPKGDARARAGEDLIDAMLSVADAKFRALALSEALALCKKAQTVARTVESDQGPIVESRIKYLGLALRSAREAEKWRGQLDEDPQNQAARDKVVRLYLIDLDNPVEAAKFIDGVADESLRKYVPAAAKPPDTVPEVACMELGDWYLKLADAAPAPPTSGVLSIVRCPHDATCLPTNDVTPRRLT